MGNLGTLNSGPSLRQTNAKGPPTGWPFCVCLADGMGSEKPRRGSTVLQEQNRTAAGWSRGATRIGIGCRDAPDNPPLSARYNEEAAQWAAFLFWLAAIAAGTAGLNRRCRRGRSNGPPADGARSAASHLRRSSPRTQAPTNASPSSTHTTVIPHNAPNVSRTGSSRSRAGSYSTRTGCPGS